MLVVKIIEKQKNKQTFKPQNHQTVLQPPCSWKSWENWNCSTSNIDLQKFKSSHAGKCQQAPVENLEWSDSRHEWRCYFSLLSIQHLHPENWAQNGAKSNFIGVICLDGHVEHLRIDLIAGSCYVSKTIGNFQTMPNMNNQLLVIWLSLFFSNKTVGRKLLLLELEIK